MSGSIMQSGGATSGVGYERVLDGACLMLYDRCLMGNLQADWFEPRVWETEGALRSITQGRGNTWFVTAPEAVTLDSKIWVLRHYRRGGSVAALLQDRYFYRGWEQSRPWREFMLLQSLRAEALPVPRVIGARIIRDGIWYRGDLITEAIEDAVTLASRLTEGGLAAPLWREVGMLVARFHAAGVYHADLNAHNVMIASDNLWLIDFDRGERRTPGLWCDAVLARLRRSILKLSDLSERAQFSEEDWISVLSGYRDGMAAARSA